MKRQRTLAALLFLSLACTPKSGADNKGANASKSAPSTMKNTASTQTFDASKEALAFIEKLQKQEFDKARERFSQEMQAAVPPDGLKQIWDDLSSKGGAYQKMELVQSFPKDAFQVVIVGVIFEKANVALQVVLDQAGMVSGFRLAGFQFSTPYQPPSYVVPGSYEEKDVTVGEGEWALPGTLTLPKGKAPFPAIVLVHGSGPHDRDETIKQQKPFKDLALGLASQGIAVLRYEKRTKQHATTMPKDITLQEETIDDAVLAVKLLQKEESINPKKIFVLGHSLGGMAAPRIGAKEPSIAGLVVLAGSTRPLEDIILEQIEYIAGLDGQVDEQDQKDLAELREEVQRVKDPALSKETDPKTLPLGIPASYWLDLRGYQPAEVAGTLSQPMLILWGQRDYQVTEKDLEVWKTGLSEKKNVTYKTYPRLNHTFVIGDTKATPEDYDKEGHVDEEVIKDISGWVKAN